MKDTCDKHNKEDCVECFYTTTPMFPCSKCGKSCGDYRVARNKNSICYDCKKEALREKYKARKSNQT